MAIVLAALTPLCKTICGSARLAATPPNFRRDHRQMYAEAKFVVDSCRLAVDSSNYEAVYSPIAEELDVAFFRPSQPRCRCRYATGQITESYPESINPYRIIPLITESYPYTKSHSNIEYNLIIYYYLRYNLISY